jgi:ABC-type branched-subunit amino acid transport system substrate-binding protein
MTAAALLASACGSSSKSTTPTTIAGSGSSPATAGGAAATGTPIKVMQIIPLNNPLYDDKPGEAGAKGAAAAINASGGINGHPIEIVICNEMFEPNAATQCGHQAVSDGVAATVGGFSSYDATIFPSLQAANIASIGNLAFGPIDFTSPVSFPLDGGAITGDVGGAIQLARAGCKHIAGMAEAAAAGTEALNLYEQGAKAAGAAWVGGFTTPEQSPNFTSQVAAAISKGADCIGYSGPPQEIPQILQAISTSGKSVKFQTTYNVLTPALIKSLGTAANGVLVVSPYLFVNSSNSAVQQMVRQITSATPGAQVDQNAETAWASVYVFAHVAKSLSSVTAANVLAKLKTLNDVQTGISAPINYGSPVQIGGLRVFNPSVYFGTVQNGGVVRSTPTPVDIAG